MRKLDFLWLLVPVPTCQLFVQPRSTGSAEWKSDGEPERADVGVQSFSEQ